MTINITNITEEARIYHTCKDGLDRFTGRFFLPETRMGKQPLPSLSLRKGLYRGTTEAALL